MNTIIKLVFSLVMCLGWINISYAQDCGPQAGSGLSGGDIIITYGASTNAVTPKKASNILLGQPLVGQSNTTKFISDHGFYSQFLLPPLQPNLVASQGELLDRIQLSWAVNPLGSAPNEGFNIFRDGIFLDYVGPQIRNYNDFNVIAGRPYTYTIQGINAFGDGAKGEALGFQVPNGVVTGQVQSQNNQPVPNALVTLLPMQGFSAGFGSEDGAWAIADTLFPFLPEAGDDWTITFWMQTDAAQNNSNIVRLGESDILIEAIESASGQEGVEVSINNGSLFSGSFDNETKNGWHHVTLANDAISNISRLYIDGKLVVQNTTSTVSDIDSLIIGDIHSSTNGNSGWDGRIDEFRIYHTLFNELDIPEIMEGTASSQTEHLTHYWKMDEELGEKSYDVINRYKLYFCGAQFDKSRPPVRTSGKTNENGYYKIESASYGTGTTFIAQPEKLFFLHKSLKLNRNEGDFIKLPDFHLTNQATIEIRVNNASVGGIQNVLSKKWGSNEFQLYLEPNGSNNEIKINLNGSTQSYGMLGTGFQHLGITIDSLSGQVELYRNGNSSGDHTYSGVTGDWSDNNSWLLGASNDTTNFFNGLVDEFAVYEGILSQATISDHSANPRDIQETGLRVYYAIDEGFGARLGNSGSVFLDFGIHEGGDWSSFAANQETEPHEFAPKTRQVTLNPSITSVDQVDFIDLSTIAVSGYVRFQGTDCFQPNVEILVNGASYSPKIFTDSIGKFIIDFEPGSSATLTPKFEDHTYSPAFWEISNVASPVAGILFNNTVRRKVSGFVAGGLCKRSIIDTTDPVQGTSCIIKVRTADGCLERIIEIKNNNGDNDKGAYEFTNLPPSENLIVSIIEHSDPDVKSYFQTLGGTTLDISKKDSTDVDFIYFAPPTISVISGLDPVSDDCDRIVFENGTLQTIGITMYEQYLLTGENGGVCDIDTADVRIINGFADVTQDTTLSGSSLKYKFRVGEPNPSPPHLKTMQIIGTTLSGRESSYLAQAIITGLRTKETTFTSTMPSTPTLILRDPPGDGSYAFVESGTQICKSTQLVIGDVVGIEASIEAHLGGNVEIITAPAGVGTIQNSGPIADANTGLNTTFAITSDNTYQTCVTFTERISTSESDQYRGSEADVYMGDAMNLIFGFADLVTFDETLCDASTEQVVNVEPGDFMTTYIYSGWHILYYIIPNLEAIAEAEQDSLSKVKYEQSIESWNNILNANEHLKDITETTENISFDAGINYEYSVTSDTSVASSLSNAFTTEQFKELKLGFEFNEFGVTAQGKITEIKSIDVINGNSSVTGTTIGYVLADDDPGDAFSIDIAGDFLFNTPIFKTVAGQSSCPWEEETANRDAPNLELAEGSSFVVNNIPANEAAVFQFKLGNLSATNEPWTYALTTGAGNNPYGAVVKLNGQPLNYLEDYIIPYGTSQHVTLTVERGPIEYDYDSLQIVLLSECEYQTSLDYSEALDDDSPFFSPVYIGVHFIRPCSEVDINVPIQDWVIYPGAVPSNENMRITVSGYDTTSTDFKAIKTQYRRSNGDGAWINIPGTSQIFNGNWSGYDNEPGTPPTLQPSFTHFFWNTEGLSDGDYEIRSLAECTGDASDKPGFSQIIKGRIDRQPPALLGVPQPSDGVYHVGDEISFTFNQDVNCNKLIQADNTQPNNVGLFDATTNDLIDATISCIDNKIVIDPNFENQYFENRILRAELHDIEDLTGNVNSFEKWEFYVDRNELAWLTDSIEMTKYSDEEKTISAKILNRGGYPVPYTIQDIPDWVHVFPNSGTLVANEIQEIHFTVDENVPLGYLSDSIIMHTETGENPFFMGGDEILSLTTRVICRPDAWIVNPDNFNASNFSYSMNFNLSLNIEGTPSDDIQDIVGAYVDGELRGVSKVEYNAQLDSYLAFLTVYSDTVTSELVEFQIWDASECKLFAPVLESFIFNANDIEGSPTSPSVLHTSGQLLRKIFVHPGWNWLSMNLDMEDASVNTALSSISNPDGALIKNQSALSMYSTLQESWFGNLDSLSFFDLYQYKAQSYDSISMVGTLVDPNTEIPVTSGWNWIGYIPNEKLPIAQALSSLTPTDGDIIKSQVSFAQYVDNIGWIGNLHFLDAPNGYLLKLSNPDILVYPDPQSLIGTGLTTYTHSSIIDGRDKKKESTTRSADHWEVDPSLYENSMNAIAIVVKNTGDNILDDLDEVAAFVGNEVRGHAKTIYIPAIDSYMIFMTIYANQDGELLTFKYYDSSTSQEFDLEEKSGFVTNNIIGEVDNPEPLHMATTTTVSDLNGEEKMSIYPNPFSSTLTINFYSDHAEEIEMSIKDVYGNNIESSMRKINNGMNVIQWTPGDHVTPGSYIVTMKDSNSYYIKKVIYVK